MPPKLEANPEAVADAIRNQALQFYNEYNANAAKPKLNALIMGPNGSGKTHLASTCPTPVFMACFDEQGWRTAALRPLIESGDLIVRAYDRDSWKQPAMYRKWEKEFHALVQSGFFEHIGTYFHDSFTSWSRYMMYEIIAKGKATSQVNQVPTQTAYRVQQYTCLDEINLMMSLPCHVIMTAHCTRETDQLDGSTEIVLEAAPSQRAEVPNAFLEKWFMRVSKKDSKPLHQIQMFNDGKYRAGTRIGSYDKFDMLEPADIRALLRKAGLDASDKPKLIELKGEVQ